MYLYAITCSALGGHEISVCNIKNLLSYLGCAVRFLLKPNDAKNKQIIFRFEAKKIFFSLVSLRSEKLEIRSETKTNEAKTAKRNEMGTKKLRK
jgi:hypothetical protein